jgi:hypothetical protein
MNWRNRRGCGRDGSEGGRRVGNLGGGGTDNKMRGARKNRRKSEMKKKEGRGRRGDRWEKEGERKNKSSDEK